LEDIFKDRQISSGAQDLLTLKIPKILYRPLAAFLNHKARITARKYGIADLERKVYLE
jgi:hypothetical protein